MKTIAPTPSIARSTENQTACTVMPPVSHTLTCSKSIKSQVKKTPAPHTKTFSSKIMLGDMATVLPKLPASWLFDVIIADPPYNIGKDFGNNHDRKSLAQYVKWSQHWINLCLKRLNKNGLLYIYGYPEILAHIAVHYPLTKQRWLVWHYKNKTVPSAKFWQRSHESILSLWKSADKQPPVLNLDQIREPYTATFLKNSAGKVRTGTHSRFGGTREAKTIYNAHPAGALPRDVLRSSIPPDDVLEVPALAGGAGAAERWFLCEDCNQKIFPPSELKHHRHHSIRKHPTQKPMDVTRRLILSRIHKNKGRLLVPFAGSGSECVTAHTLGIPYLGIELNPEFVNFARKWLRKIK